MHHLCVGNLTSLLDETAEAYYWVGFLMADGYFSGSAVKLHLSEKDAAHLSQYAQFVSYRGTCRSACVNLRNPEVVTQIMAKFSISNQKTYKPCPFPQANDDLVFALIVGLIDGDGHIRVRREKAYSIDIKMHGSWLGFLEQTDDFLHQYCGLKKSKPTFARLNDLGYARLVLSNSSLLEVMKSRVECLSLPVMARKWSLVGDSHLTTRRKKREALRQAVVTLLAEGHKRRSICDILQMTKPTLGRFIRQERL
ncbi:MAG: helix-turn-helix domain-containing protein [Armatimonadetes bacterium]|nr:helix-turn-helix domain-containing protein [Armatimonadota bacterium]